MIQVVDRVNDPLFVEAHIADIHFGAIDAYTQYKILDEQFISYIEDMNVLDIISINGDLFDHRFMANSYAVAYATYFIQRLADICRRKRCTLILISGTGSHDSDQLKLFIPLATDPSLDIRIVFETQFLYVRGKKILVIPEQYGMGEEYYNKFLLYSGFYDACYMHGTFVGAVPMMNERDLNSNREPVFDINDFGSCYGPIISGHVHVADVYKNDFYYCGSPIRYSFGEEQDKGFLILLHNIETHKYQIHFEPIYSFRYDTITIDDIINKDPNDVINYISSLQSQGIDHVRVKFTDNDVAKISLLREYYRNNSTVKIVSPNIEEVRIKRELEDMNDKYSQYTYLFNDDLSPLDKLVQFMNANPHSDMIWTTQSLQEFIDEIKNL